MNPTPHDPDTTTRPEIQSPVVDPEALGPGEDVEREPGGAPHAVIGLTVLVLVGFALAIGALLAVGGPAGLVAAIVLAVVGAPMAIAALRRSAAAQRDRRHASR